jgi:hypothetical protein
MARNGLVSRTGLKNAGKVIASIKKNVKKKAIPFPEVDARVSDIGSHVHVVSALTAELFLGAGEVFL